MEFELEIKEIYQNEIIYKKEHLDHNKSGDKDLVIVAQNNPKDDEIDFSMILIVPKDKLNYLKRKIMLDINSSLSVKIEDAI
ncbi:MAG: hypothetical protein GF317_05880 [Candidatus Lokiarchaeota archaeon]|nr:hypothetical protein [Candidatus Lokiarchaeota archaeon]